jgi:hypothetical protein
MKRILKKWLLPNKDSTQQMPEETAKTHKTSHSALLILKPDMTP